MCKVPKIKKIHHKLERTIKNKRFAIDFELFCANFEFFNFSKINNVIYNYN